MANAAQQRSSLWPCDDKVTERPTIKSIKVLYSILSFVSVLDYDFLSKPGKLRLLARAYRLLNLITSYWMVKNVFCYDVLYFDSFHVKGHFK